MSDEQTDWKCRQGRGEQNGEPLPPEETVLFWAEVLLALAFLSGVVSCVVQGAPT